jgi:hypothetical protein
MHRLPTIAAKLTSASMLPMGRETGRLKKCLKTAAALAALAAVFCVLLAGCGQMQQPQLIGTLTPSPQSSPTATRTEALHPTGTLTPSHIFQWESTFTLDLYSQQQSDEIRTTEAAFATEQMAAAQFPTFCSGYSTYNSLSPDKQWLAVDCRDAKKFMIISRDGKFQWSITNQQILDPYRSIYGQYFEYLYVDGFAPVHWSPDSRNLYFLAATGPSPSGACPVLEFHMGCDSEPLYRLDTTSGIWNKFLPYTNEVSFSPTERRLVSVLGLQKNHVTITTVDLKTGGLFEQRIDGAIAAGYFVWTDDGRRVFFSTMKYPTDTPNAFEYKIFSLDTQDNTLTLLQEYKDSFAIVFPLNVSKDNVLVIASDKRYTREGFSYQFFDLNTNTFIEPTPTP